MAEEAININFDDNVIMDYYKHSLQSSIISDILSYTYAEERTAEQISNYIHLHIIKTQYYLDHLVKEGLLLEKVTPVIDGLINKTYKLINNINTTVKINSEEKLAVEAKHFGTMVEQIVSTMKPEKYCLAHVTGVLVDEIHAKIILQKIKELHELLENYEKECEGEKTGLKQYNFITVFGEIE